MRRAVLSVLLLAGCMSELPHEDPTTVQRGACAALEGHTFTSVTEGECGLTPDGPATCTWQITFLAGDASRSRFEWGHSDVAESGFVTCDEDSIRSDEATLYEGHFDATDTSLELMWDAVAYTLAL